MTFAPQWAARPVAQRDLWPELKQVPERFVLYGGTALAPRLGHRQSLDFFANAPVDPAELLAQMLGAAQAVYGEPFFPMNSLKALAWFGDGDLPSLPEAVKDALRAAAGSVTELVTFQPLPGGVSLAGA